MVRNLILEAGNETMSPTSLPSDDKITGMHKKGFNDIWFVTGEKSSYYLVRKSLINQLSEYTCNVGNWCPGNEFMAFSTDTNTHLLINYKLKLYKQDMASIHAHIDANGGMAHNVMLHLYEYQREYLTLPEVRAEMEEPFKEALSRIEKK